MSKKLSKSEQLQQLRDENLLYGWGAAMSIGRKALNILLQDAFLGSLGNMTYLEPFADYFPINEGNSQVIEIEGLVIGPAQVSFESAVATDRLVTVRMNLLAGEYRYRLHLPGEPPRFHRSFTIREQMGFYLEARCRLALVMDPVALKRQIVLDLSEATHFTCNLGERPYERTKIGERLQAWLAEQPEERRLLRLGEFDMRNYQPLSLTNGSLITHPAPWAGEPGKQGDGALVVFMQTGVDWEPGNLPAGNYAYSLPEDGSADIALATQTDLRDLKLGEPADVLKSLTLGNRRQITLTETHQLDAVLSFGKLARGTLNRELQPAFTTLGATQSCQFMMSGGTGATEWRARNMFRPLATGSMDAGLYRARASQDFVKKTQMVLVTGHAAGDDERTSASALVVETDQPLTIAPQTVNWSIDDPTIEFVAAGGAAVTWTLEGDKVGSLVSEGHRATFTPAAPPDPSPPVQRQRVRVKYNDNGLEYATEACVIIVNRPSSLGVEPFYVAREDSFTPITFSLAEDWREALAKAGIRPPDALQQSDIVWSVVGEGSITPEGLYTPPDSAVSSASVVRAVVRNRLSGYAIIEHGQRQGTRSASVANWNKLSHFYVKASTTPECYANGMQQIQIQVDIQTDQEDGFVDPISDDELQTLKFYTVNGSELKVVDVGIEPPAAGTPGTWVMRRSHNPLLEMRGTSGASPAPVPAAAGQTLWDYWLQTTSTVPVEVYAMFKQSGLGGRWFSSVEQSKDNGKVRVQGLTLPTYDPATDYPWSAEEKRVKQEGKAVGNDTFNYMTLTVDYWKLTHVQAPGKRIPFVAIDIDWFGNKSVMRWASDEYEDELCSYSGFMVGGLDEEMIYDGALARMAGKRGLTLEKLEPTRAPASGELLFSLNRVTNFRQRYETPDDPDILTDEEAPQREHLLRTFKFRLLDQQGNRHDLQIGYPGSGRDGRNTFLLSRQPKRT
ncbi:hypothetical protein [Pseudomonas putida]|uniref:hypothetical protein n=1 Tax=Pseudomonas putida TaxID=303 RepID=UPI0009A20BBE|nr:hypothetical protein [Pseudomonas putida]